VQRHLQIASNFRIDLPEDLIQAVDGCKIMQIRQVGIEWAIQQSLELKAAGVPDATIILGKSENIKEIASRVFRS
jgi:methylenetetrahydrofolate reductase (NADPH)